MQILAPLLIVAAAFFIGGGRTTDIAKAKVLVACGWFLVAVIFGIEIMMAVNHAW